MKKINFSVLISYKFLFCLLLITIIIELIIYLNPIFLKSSQNKNSVNTNPITITKNNLSNSMKINGAQLTYLNLKQQYQSNFKTGHEMAHLFGELLFKNFGNESIAICDSTFGFGCFHGFIIEAISTKGISIVNQLDQTCINKNGQLGLGCQHGIGHGLLEYLGRDKLVESLKICDTLNWKGRLLGCKSGVFMEYFFPNQLSSQTQDNQTTWSPSPTVCTELNSEFRGECIYQQTQYWNNQYNHDYLTIDTKCQKLINLSDREICLLSLGNLISIDMKLNSIQTKNICTSLSHQDSILCLSGAYWTFSDRANNVVEEAQTICDLDNKQDKQTCIEKSDLTKY